MSKTYAVYKGEEMLVMGTAKECAEALNVKTSTIHFYKNEAYQNRGSGKSRRITIELDDELEDM